MISPFECNGPFMNTVLNYFLKTIFNFDNYFKILNNFNTAV